VRGLGRSRFLVRKEGRKMGRQEGMNVRIIDLVIFFNDNDNDDDNDKVRTVELEFIGNEDGLAN